jgi:hypothetical protein
VFRVEPIFAYILKRVHRLSFFIIICHALEWPGVEFISGPRQYQRTPERVTTSPSRYRPFSMCVPR